jgi:hypothetical protein
VAVSRSKRPSRPSEADGTDTIRLEIRLPRDPSVEVKYANHVVANFNEGAFVVTFAQVVPPPLHAEEKLLEVLAEGYIEGKVITRLVIPADKFAEMVESFGKLVSSLRARGLISKPKEAE